MSNFIVRVELHGATESTYTKLHEEMAKNGYQRFIRGADGQMYRLPTAEYVAQFNGTITATATREHVDRIVATVWNSSWTLVTRYDDVAWRLQPIAKAA